jgi:hypothetical protein
MWRRTLLGGRHLARSRQPVAWWRWAVRKGTMMPTPVDGCRPLLVSLMPVFGTSPSKRSNVSKVVQLGTSQL